MPYDLPDWLERKIIPEPNSGCWLWLGQRDTHGYGKVVLKRGSRIQAHRFIYEFYNGIVDSNLVVDHICRNTSCVNPEHLEPVLHRTNILRGFNPAADNHKRLTCIHGHPLVHVSYATKRICRICRRAASARYKEKLK